MTRSTTLETPVVTPRGFTLLEMLVVLALLAIVMVGLLSALRSMGETEARVDTRLARLDEARTAHAFLGQILSRASSTPMPAPDNPANQVTPFTSDGSSVSWVGIMPARPDIGGRHFFHLSLETEPGTEVRALVLRYTPWEPAKPWPDWSTLTPHVVRHNVTRFAVECRGEPPFNQPAPVDWPNDWQRGWLRKDAVPQVVRLAMDDDGGAKPAWVFRLTVMEITGPGLGGPRIGGGLFLR